MLKKVHPLNHTEEKKIIKKKYINVYESITGHNIYYPISLIIITRLIIYIVP